MENKLQKLAAHFAGQVDFRLTAHGVEVTQFGFLLITFLWERIESNTGRLLIETVENEILKTPLSRDRPEAPSITDVPEITPGRTRVRLKIHTEDGKLVLRDDVGRKVEGVRNILVHQQIREATRITVEFVSTPSGERSMLDATVWR